VESHSLPRYRQIGSALNPSSIVEARYEELKDVEVLSAAQKLELEAKYGAASIIFKLSSGARLTVFELSAK
jgi:hypothetical protein